MTGQVGGRPFSVHAEGERVGRNRPDLAYTDSSGNRVYAEYDRPSSNRGMPHADRILSNDPTGFVAVITQGWGGVG